MAHAFEHKQGLFMLIFARFGVGYSFMESLVQLQIFKAINEIGAYLKLALPVVKAVAAVQISVLVFRL